MQELITKDKKTNLKFRKDDLFPAKETIEDKEKNSKT